MSVIEEVEHPSVIIDVAEPTEDDIQIEFPDELVSQQSGLLEESIEILDDADEVTAGDFDDLDNVVPLESQQTETEESLSSTVAQDSTPDVADENLPAPTKQDSIPD